VNVVEGPTDLWNVVVVVSCFTTSE
jgi:hypothetical protein